MVTILLLGIAGVQLQSDDTKAIAGAIIGYVAAYWLPARRDKDE